MTVADISAQVLTWLITYGAPVLALALFVGALGLPLPGTLFVIAAGAFVRQGVLDLYSLVSLALVGVVLGDLVSKFFIFGRIEVEQSAAEHRDRSALGIERPAMRRGVDAAGQTADDR